MPGKTGIRLAQELAEEGIDCEVIFTTAYSEYAIQTFRLSAIDYLLKPIKEEDLIEAIQKVKQKQHLAQAQQRLSPASARKKNLCLHTGNTYEYIKISAIECLKAEGSYVNVVLNAAKQYIISKNLKHFETLLEGFEEFVIVHHSFIRLSDNFWV